MVYAECHRLGSHCSLIVEIKTQKFHLLRRINRQPSEPESIELDITNLDSMADTGNTDEIEQP